MYRKVCQSLFSTLLSFSMMVSSAAASIHRQTGHDTGTQGNPATGASQDTGSDQGTQGAARKEEKKEAQGEKKAAKRERKEGKAAKKEKKSEKKEDMKKDEPK